MKVIYEEIDSCNDCLYNKNSLCYELSRPIKQVNFEHDCPLPTKEIVESFTKYVDKNNSTRVCGNCKEWDRWAYNKSIKTEIGTCSKGDILMFCHCNSKACKDFKGV